MEHQSRQHKKRKRFKRLASHRTEQVLKRLEILGNCANRSNYKYTEEEVNKIFRAIEEKTKEVKSQFRYSKNNREEFRL